jgi:hypothetical protein
MMEIIQNRRELELVIVKMILIATGLQLKR